MIRFVVSSDNTVYKSVDGVLLSKDGLVLLQYPSGKAGPYTVPAGVTTIYLGAFNWSAKLTSVTIPDSVTSIDLPVFNGCSGLTSIEVDPGNAMYGSIGGVLFDRSGEELIRCPAGMVGEYTVPTGVTTIGLFAFKGCARLTSVTIADTVSYIDDDSFYGCTGLRSVTIPDSVEAIGNKAFEGCTALDSVTLPSGIDSIWSDTFRGCVGLTSVTLPYGLKDIGSNAFRGCVGLTSLTLPDTLTAIRNSAFAECTGLSFVTLPNGTVSVESYAFMGCTGLEWVTIPATVDTIGMGAFYGCEGLLEFIVSPANGSYKDIDGVLYTTDGGTLVQYPSARFGTYSVYNGVSTIGYGAFASCSGLTWITLPDSVTAIEYSAFKNCVRLPYLALPEGLTDIGDEAFSGCVGITSVKLPCAVTDIGYEAFYGCTSLTGFDVCPYNQQYKDIDGVLFSKDGSQLIQYPCGREGPYTVPKTVLNIVDGAFDHCVGLTRITVHGSVEIGSYLMFIGCSSLTEIVVGDGFSDGKVVSSDGALYSGDSTVLYRCPEGRTGYFFLPNSVERITYNAFAHSSLSWIVVHEGDRIQVDPGAFTGCNPDLEFVSGKIGFRLEVYRDAEMTQMVTGVNLSHGDVGTLYLKWVEIDPEVSGAETNMIPVISGVLGLLVLTGAMMILFIRRKG